MTNEPIRLAVAAMGTRFELALVEGRGDLRAAGEAACDEIETWHRRLSRFSPDSLLSHINRTAASAPVKLDSDAFHLFAMALQVWRESAGAFDITVAPLMARHGFQDSAVPAVLGRVGSDAIVLDADRWTIAFSRDGVSLDLGGIAKGHALDAASAVLREGGVTRALLHGGTSTVVAIGRPAGEDGWRVAIAPPAAGCVVTLCDTAMSVSDGASQRGPMRGGSHIIDPRSAQSVPTDGPIAIVGPSAAVTDAWSTALAVLRHQPLCFPDGYRSIGLPPVPRQQECA